MKKVLQLKASSKSQDLKTPNDGIASPIDHSTGIKQVSTKRQRFFPSVTTDSPDLKEPRQEPLASVIPKLNNMSSLLNGISIGENDVTARSSLGLLPDGVLETSPLEDSKTFVDWRLTQDDSIFKKPKNQIEKKSTKFGLDDKYFQPSTPHDSTQPVNLDDILGSTINETGPIENLSWSEVFNGQPKITLQPPSDGSFDASFFKGCLSGRSTSIGGVSQSNRTRTLDEKFDDFTKQSFDGIKMDDDDFGPVATDNLALINAEEQKMQEENKFMKDDQMDQNNVPSFHQNQSDIMDVTSQSRYFCKNTSRLGSLESSVCPAPEDLRPQFGFEKIVSPEKEPIKILEATLNKTFNKDQKKDITNLLKALLSDKDNNNLKDKIRQHLEPTIKKDDTVALDALTSFLEASICPEPSNIPQPPKSPLRRAPPPSKSPSRIPVSMSKLSNKENNRPMMGTKASSHGKLLKPLADNNTRKLRHSSPIKAPLGPVKSTPAVTSNDEFPIQANRLQVIWITSQLTSVAEEIVVLKNGTSKHSAISLTIKDCADFRFSNGKQTQEITINPLESKPITILFEPKMSGILSGILAIRVHGYRNKHGKAVKSSLQLRGFVGQPEIKVNNDILQPDLKDGMKMTLFEMSNDTATLKEIELVNQGDAAGYVVLEAFGDVKLTSKINWMTGPVRLDCGKFLLCPGEAKKVTIRIDPELAKSSEPDFLASIVLHWGSEWDMEILYLHKKLPFDFEPANLEKTRRYFREGMDVDLKKCKLNIKLLNIYGAKSSESFYALPVEETLSESMMNVSCVPNAFTSTMEVIEEEFPSCLTVESDRVFAPDVKVGDSSVFKVKIKNQGEVTHLLNISGLQAPFSVNHTRVEIKPKFFLNLPILYSPTTKASHESVLILKSLTDPRMLPINVTVKGSTLK